MGYLAAAPVIRFWRIDDEIFICWDTRNKRVEGHLCWIESRGQQVLSVSRWQSEWQDFVIRLDSAMQERLAEVAGLGLLTPDQIASLDRQHQANFAPAGTWQPTDWAQVLASIKKLQEWSGVKLP